MMTTKRKGTKMDEDTFLVKIPRQKTRAHKVLFDKELPFAPKREQPKTAYSRKQKHRNNRNDES